MTRFIARRTLETFLVLLAVHALTFFMLKQAPGGPFSSDKQIPPEILKNIEAYYGLDRPLLVQYGQSLGRALRGDLGPSYKYPNRTVNELIASAFPVSLELGLWSLMVALGLGVTAGLVAALRKNTVTDFLPMSLAMIGICVPTFVMGPLLILGTAIHWGLFNTFGWDSMRDRVLPSLVLGAYYAAYVARLTRGGMLEVLNQDYIRTARAKGAGPFRIVFKHAFRGGILPVVSFLGPALAGIITGSFVVESIFQVPGLGRFFVQSAFNRDYTLVLGTVLFYATLITSFNLFVDMLLVWLNPKLRLE